jgi:hypothetical protein
MIHYFILLMLIIGTSVPAYAGSIDKKEQNIQLKDESANESDVKIDCAKQTRDQAEQTIKTTWDRMAALMVSGDYEKALEFFSYYARDEMKRKMARLSREDIRQTFSNYKSVEVLNLHLEDGVAECGIIREEKTGTYSYPASFIRGPDCVWLIRGF